MLLWGGCSLDSEGIGFDRGLGEGRDDTQDPATGRLDASLEGGPDARPPREQPLDGPSDSGGPAVDASAEVVATDAEARDAAPDAEARDAAPDARDAAPDAGDAAAADAGVACELAGTFGLLVDLNVTWPATSLGGVLDVLQPGQGHLRVFATVRQDANGNGSSQPCGITVPDFEGAPDFGGELYGGDIPNAAWDATTMPSWRSPWLTSCNHPGCAYTSAPGDAVLGARQVGGPFSWPAPGNWVAAGTLASADDDSDGKPGITMITRGPPLTNGAGRPYAYPPIGVADLGRARALHLALGLRMPLAGVLESCDLITGTAPTAQVHVSALGCTGVLRGESAQRDCIPEVTQFVDANLPARTVQSATFRMVRLPAASGCFTTRALLAP